MEQINKKTKELMNKDKREEQLIKHKEESKDQNFLITETLINSYNFPEETKKEIYENSPYSIIKIDENSEKEKQELMAVYWTRKIQENHKFRKNNDQNYTLAELKNILLDSEQIYIYWCVVPEGGFKKLENTIEETPKQEIPKPKGPMDENKYPSEPYQNSDEDFNLNDNIGREPVNQEIQGPNLIDKFISAKDNKTLSGNFYLLVDENIPNFVSNESERNLYCEKVIKNQDNTLFLTKDCVGKITYKSDTPTELTNSHNLMESSRNAYQGENLIGVYFTNGTRPAKKEDNKPFNIDELIALGNGSEKIILLWNHNYIAPVEKNNPSEEDQRYDSTPYEDDNNQEPEDQRL